MVRIVLFFAVFSFALFGSFDAGANTLASPGGQIDESAGHLIDLVARDIFEQSAIRRRVSSFDALSEKDKQAFRDLAKALLMGNDAVLNFPTEPAPHRKTGVEI